MFNDPRIIMPPQREFAYPPFVFFEKALSCVECEAIKSLAVGVGLEPGQIGNGGPHDAPPETVESYRKVDTTGLLPHFEFAGTNIHWLFERVRDRVQWANDNHFHFDLHGLWQNINYLRYQAAMTPDEEPGHYDWHQDYGGGTSSQRKLSVVIQLSKPEDYDGCRLHFFTQNEFDPGHVGQGDMIVFPSWQVHRVTPITRGERHALVSWVSGPPFR